MKIKVVQIAIAASETEIRSEYLDDMGRVWYEVYDNTSKEYLWKQLNLPDEPKKDKH